MGFYVYTEKTSHIFYFTFASWWILSVYISVFFSIDIAHLFMFMLSSHIYYSVLSYLVSFEEARLVREGNKKKIIFTVIGYIPPHKIHHFVTKKTSTPPKPPTSRFFSLFFWYLPLFDQPCLFKLSVRLYEMNSGQPVRPTISSKSHAHWSFQHQCYKHVL